MKGEVEANYSAAFCAFYRRQNTGGYEPIYIHPIGDLEYSLFELFEKIG